MRTQKKNPYFFPVTKLEKRKNKKRKQPTNQKNPKKQVVKKITAYPVNRWSTSILVYITSTGTRIS